MKRVEDKDCSGTSRKFLTSHRSYPDLMVEHSIKWSCACSAADKVSFDSRSFVPCVDSCPLLPPDQGRKNAVHCSVCPYLNTCHNAIKISLKLSFKYIILSPLFSSLLKCFHFQKTIILVYCKGIATMKNQSAIRVISLGISM